MVNSVIFLQHRHQTWEWRRMRVELEAANTGWWFTGDTPPQEGGLGGVRDAVPTDSTGHHLCLHGVGSHGERVQ